MIVFPGLNDITSVANDVSCSSTKKVTVVRYNASPIYQIVGFSSDYKTSNTATSLNLSSSLVMAVCRPGLTTMTSSGATILDCGTCAGLRAVGGVGTYFADAITAAQNALTAASRPNVQNVMILVSDGGAGNGAGAPVSNQCHDAVTAARNAANAGTWVYSIAYGSSTAISPNGNSCSDTERLPISACTTMAIIASDPTKFYSDPMGSTRCTSKDNPSPEDIVNIFATIGVSLHDRLSDK